MSIQQLLLKAKPQILEYLHDYGITSDSLLTDAKKIVLHCSLHTLLEELTASETLLLVDLKWNCDADIASIIGEDKCQKSLTYMSNNLKRIFKYRFLELKEMPHDEDLPGEVIEAALKQKSFNFKKLTEFLEKNSLSGLKRTVKENLSVKQKIFSNFQN